MRTILAFILSVQVAFGALNFSDSNSHGVCIGPSISSQSATMALWWKRSGTVSDVIAAFSAAATGNMSIWRVGSTQWAGYSVDSSGNVSGPEVNLVGSSGSWIHLAFVVNSSSQRVLYENGNPVRTNTVERTLPTLDRVILGGYWISSAININFYSSPELSQVAAWSTNLAPSDIASLAAGASPDKIRQDNLVFYAPLENIGPGGGSGTAVNLVGPPVMLTNTVTQSTTQPRIYR